MRLRKACVADLDEIERMAEAAKAKGKTDGTSTWSEEYPTRETFAERIEQDALYVLEDEGVLAGMAALLPRDYDDGVPSTHWTDDEGRLVSLVCVRPDLQGRGLAARMLEMLEEICVTEDAFYMRLLANAKNSAALRLYARLGYAAKGTLDIFGGEYVCEEKAIKRKVSQMLWFQNDYGHGAHPAVLRALTETNTLPTTGYGRDEYCENARRLIREKIACPRADIHFIPGGTQTNLLAISSLLRPWEAVMTVATGHINVHETGAIEGTGHKVLTRPAADGKVTCDMVRDMLAEHTTHHMVKPAMVYISQPTELGTHYTLDEIASLHALCRERGLLLYLDGARLASALCCSDVTLADIARLTDIFYIGGTKCGALFGEALVIPDPALSPDILYAVKLRGARFAKGRLLGLQFGALMENDLYEEIGRHENAMARILKDGLAQKGVSFYTDSDTNQLFPIVSRETASRLAESATFETEYALDDGMVAIRLVTSWATTEEDCEAFIALF